MIASNKVQNASRRLHPLSLLFEFASILRANVIPTVAAIVSTTTRRETAGAKVLHTRAEFIGMLETADARSTLRIFTFYCPRLDFMSNFAGAAHASVQLSDQAAAGVAA